MPKKSYTAARQRPWSAITCQGAGNHDDGCLHKCNGYLRSASPRFAGVYYTVIDELLLPLSLKRRREENTAVVLDRRANAVGPARSLLPYPKTIVSLQ
jgi:hypothetical protein